MVLLLSICPFATVKMGKNGVIGLFTKICLGKMVAAYSLNQK